MSGNFPSIKSTALKIVCNILLSINHSRNVPTCQIFYARAIAYHASLHTHAMHWQSMGLQTV